MLPILLREKIEQVADLRIDFISVIVSISVVFDLMEGLIDGTQILAADDGGCEYTDDEQYDDRIGEIRGAALYRFVKDILGHQDGAGPRLSLIG